MVEVTVGSGGVTDWLTAAGTVVGAVATAVLVWLAYMQLGHLRRELRESRRPLLATSEPGLAPTGRFRVQVRNIGVGPAVTVQVQAVVTVLSVPEQPPFHLEASGGPVVPQEAPVLLGYCVTGDYTEFLRRTGRGVVVAYQMDLTTIYTDVFGDHYVHSDAGWRAEAATGFSLTFAKQVSDA